MARTDIDRLAKLQKRRAQLDAKISDLKAKKKEAERKLDLRRKIIVGSAILAHAASHPDFAKTLQEILRMEVTRNLDKKAIADLLSPEIKQPQPEQGTDNP